ncbi:MAG TPA: hypothetical protein VK539_22140 [Myxococcaceae bacterium]|nr:hypothetical protein [Myxococcaceae bacterium]
MRSLSLQKACLEGFIRLSVRGEGEQDRLLLPGVVVADEEPPVGIACDGLGVALQASHLQGRAQVWLSSRVEPEADGVELPVVLRRERSIGHEAAIRLQPKVQELAPDKFLFREARHV